MSTNLHGAAADIDLHELRAESMQLLVYGLLVLSAVVMFLAVEGARPLTLAPVAVLFLGVLLAQQCQRLAQPAGVVALLAVLFLVVTLGLHVYPSDFGLVSFPLVAVAAGLLLGPAAGAAAAGLVSVLALLLAPGAVAGPESSFADAVVFGAWAGAGLSWLASRPVYTALGWAWNSYAELRGKTEELRDRQGELNQALKGLDEACCRLERANEELARAREAAEEARRAKVEFASTISHELRTPLNLIIGFSEMMVLTPRNAYGEALPESYRGDVEAIYRNACHISNLIEDVLDLSQIEAHRMALDRRRTALAGIVEAAAATVESLFKDKGLSLALDLPADLPLVYVDPTRVRQILINLLNNAARFTNRGGVTIRARSSLTPRAPSPLAERGTDLTPRAPSPLTDPAQERRPGDEVHVSVADTGVGIPAADLPTVFQQFSRSSDPLRRRYGGSGLGLAVSKRFAEMHGGSMWVESQEGAGSTFHFTLPLCENVVSVTTQAGWDQLTRTALAAGDARTVAVVGGDQEAARVFRRYLDGYRVVAADTVSSLDQVAGQPAPQAIVLIRSPDGVGLDLTPGTPSPLLERRPGGEVGTSSPFTDPAQERRPGHEGSRWTLRASEPELGVANGYPPSVPMLVCEMHTLRSTARHLGVLDYLVKPVTREQLGAALSRLGKGARCLLVVEDDPEMARLLVAMARSLSRRFRVRCAHSGDEGLRLLEEQRPDVLLLDLLMPGLSGYEVLERIRSREDLRHVPVIVVSARGRDDETVVVGRLSLSRPGGLSVGEAMRCVRGGLDVLLNVPDAASAAAPSIAPPG
ncbi:MAG: response regulator [Chloroflexi bacterium]|nr:response regulator [Chloroflexota bacterium]